MANVAEAQYCSKIRRVCRVNLDNEVFWNTNSSVPCGTFKQYNIYARDNTSNPYTKITTETIESATNFTHLNANVPSNKNWDYFIETVYTCTGTDQFCYSDTQNVASFNLPKSKIAYVTIDIDSEFPVIVWEKNNYPSFWYVDLFNDNSIKTAITDTFYIDKISGGNPKANVLKYVIAAVDSCTKRWDYLPEDYHYTINLKGYIDTCSNTVNLNWTKYIGWTDSIKYYYIYKMLNKSNYVLLDSVRNNTTTYIDKILTNDVYDYYIAAVNSKYLNYRSCSNNATFISGTRNNNQALLINYITLNNKINININYNTLSDLDSVFVFKSNNNAQYSIFYKTKPTSSPINIIDNSEDGSRRVYYYLVSKNTCGVKIDSTKVSTNILLENNHINTNNNLFWNKYFTWNNGIEKYAIHRETRINTDIIKPFAERNSTNDSNYTDDVSNENISQESLCYKIIATENNTGYKSQSNEVCIVGGLAVYFPNGIIKRGTENFKPVGIFIDYTKSTMVIYNRWGKLVKEINDLSIGWDLSDSNNNFAESDTYVYDAHIVGLDGKIVNQSGTITIIR